MGPWKERSTYVRVLIHHSNIINAYDNINKVKRVQFVSLQSNEFQKDENSQI